VVLLFINQAAQGQTVKDTGNLRFADFHFAMVTPLSTNGMASGRTVNKTSFNMLFGYSGGLDGFELGNFINAEKHYVKGFQAAGFANFNNGWTNGTQLSSFANFSNGETQGLQAGGMMNITTEAFSGAQVSGFMNYAENVDGAQVSGFINVAEQVSGTQIGILNVADSFDKGVPIGFLSFVKNGYNHVEAWGSEAFHANLSAKLGVSEFYNIFSIGREFGTQKDFWGIGYGIGTNVPFNQKWGMNMDLLSYDINMDNNMLSDETAMLTTLKINANYHIGNFEVFAGPSVNLLAIDEGLNQSKEGRPISEAFGPSPMRETTNNGTLYQGWIGANIGIRY
jgi:hypothetical protein